MGAFRCDFGAFWAAFGCGSFVNYVMDGFRECRSGGLPAVLGRDFQDNFCFSWKCFCVFGYGLDSPGVSFGQIWARSDAISSRSWPHFGAGLSYFTLWWDFEGAVQAGCRRFWDSSFMKNHVFAKSILRLWGCPRII